MEETTIGNLTLGAVDGTTLFEQERTVSGSQVSEKVTSSSVANFVGTSAQFAGLSTTAKNLVGAINEAAQSGGGSSVIQLTQAEYTALSTAEKMNGSIYKLTDKAIFYCLDEEYHAVKELTTAQYEALSTAEKNDGTIYIQTDAETTGEDIPVNTLTPDTSINSAINACFGRTGSDIPISSGETETIAEAIEALNAVTSGSLTLDSTYIKTAEINRWVKKGNVVEFWLTATVNTAWTANNIFASGLPAPLGSGRILGLDTSSNTPLRIQMTANGSIANAYSSTAPVSNHIIEVHGTYIAGG